MLLKSSTKGYITQGAMKESHRESLSWMMKDIHKGAGQVRQTACAKSQ